MKTNSMKISNIEPPITKYALFLDHQQKLDDINRSEFLNDLEKEIAIMNEMARYELAKWDPQWTYH
jgi:hypothetical protein